MKPKRVHDRGLWASFPGAKAWKQENRVTILSSQVVCRLRVTSLPSLGRRPSSGDHPVRVMRVHEYYLRTTLTRGATNLVHEHAPYPLRSLGREAGRLVHNVHRVSRPDPGAQRGDRLGRRARGLVHPPGLALILHQSRQTPQQSRNGNIRLRDRRRARGLVRSQFHLKGGQRGDLLGR